MKLLLDLIAPHHCLSCNSEGSLLCNHCKDKIPRLESGCFLCSKPTAGFRTCKKCVRRTNINKVYIYGEYSDLLKELVHKIKFGRSRDTSKILAKLAYECLINTDDNFDVITYIPTATSRVRKRGYDQSAAIAKQLAKLIGVEFKETLARIDQTRSVGSSKVQRTNQQEYRLRHNLKNKSILLLDDVITTGGTFVKAASYFDKSNQVTGVAIAKTLLK